MDRDAMPIYALLAGLLLFIGVCVYFIYQEDQACKSANGHWVETGETYTTTTTIMVGKVAVPQTQTHEETECRHIETGEVIELN
jgi:hypothetical protein